MAGGDAKKAISSCFFGEGCPRHLLKAHVRKSALERGEADFHLFDPVKYVANALMAEHQICREKLIPQYGI